MSSGHVIGPMPWRSVSRRIVASAGIVWPSDLSAAENAAATTSATRSSSGPAEPSALRSSSTRSQVSVFSFVIDSHRASIVPFSELNERFVM